MDTKIPLQAADLVLTAPDQLLYSPPGRAAMFSPTTLQRAMQYLYWYGYLTSERLTVEGIQSALTRFQTWFGMSNHDELGRLGAQTCKAVDYPRCGCPDEIDASNGRHVEYLKLQAFTASARKRWNKTGLKYFVRHLIEPSLLAPQTQLGIIQQAWQQWTEVADLQIEQVTDETAADLIIDTGRGQSADFDGPAGTLAWAYMPDGSDHQLLMRFDLDELWTADPKDNGVCMLNVACHEFGHMLGLDHSRSAKALMAPFYNESVSKPQDNDDIPRVQALYGAPHPSLTSLPSVPSQEFILRIKGILTVDGYNLVADQGLQVTGQSSKMQPS